MANDDLMDDMGEFAVAQMAGSHPRPMPKPPKNRAVVKVNAMSQAHLIRLLWDGDMTCKELAEESGLHYVTVLQYTRELHKAGAAHIARYDPDSRGSHTIKVYKLGPGRDAKRPKLTEYERTKRYRDRKSLARQLGLIGGSQCPSH